MGGEVGVSSEPGQGSTFWVTTRIVPQAEQPNFSPLGKGKRILVVDDIAASRRTLALKLRFFSYDAVTVASVDEALAYLDTGDPVDLVVADELMPFRGGLDLLAALRADPRHAALPFVLLSLFGAEHDVDNWPHKPNAIGSKPIRASKLGYLLNAVFTGESLRLPVIAEVRPSFPTYRGRRILPGRGQPRQPARRAARAAKARRRRHHRQQRRRSARAHRRNRVRCRTDGLPDARHGRLSPPRRSIREAERLEGHGKRLPIIALTANVMSEDREHCIARRHGRPPRQALGAQPARGTASAAT